MMAFTLVNIRYTNAKGCPIVIPKNTEIFVEPIDGVGEFNGDNFRIYRGEYSVLV